MTDDLVSLTQYEKNHDWPSKRQWRNIISKRMPMAKACVKRVGNKYFIDEKKLMDFLTMMEIDEDRDKTS